MLLSLNLQTQQTHTMPNPAGPFQPLGVVGGVQQNNLQGLATAHYLHVSLNLDLII